MITYQNLNILKEFVNLQIDTFEPTELVILVGEECSILHC